MNKKKKIIWKDIKGYEGLYQINNYGEVKSLYNYRGVGNLLKQRIKKGYYTIGLRKNNLRKWYYVHRLVAQAFIPNSNNLPQINHKDENKLNNCVDNLEWCSASYNNSYGNRLEKVSRSNKLKKKVLQFDINGNMLQEYNSIAEASKITNVDRKGISNCINKKNNRKTAGGYIWKLKSEVIYNA